MTVRLPQIAAQFIDESGRPTRALYTALNAIVSQVNDELATQSSLLNITTTVTAQQAAIASLTRASASIGAPTLAGVILATDSGTDPVAADLPDGYYAMYKSSVSGLCLFANDGGVVKKIALT